MPEFNCLTLPFGDGPDCSGTEATRHRFTGKERDPESKLDYFGARHYSSSMGRFMSPDWSSKAEPVPYSSLDNPQTLNLYGYVNNNPLSHADADGHCCESDFNSFSDHPGRMSGGTTDIDRRVGTVAVGVGKMGLGVALVGTAALGDEPGAVTGGAIVFSALKTVSAALSGTTTAMSGLTDVTGAVTKTDVSGAQQALSATGNLGGLVTTAATGGNLKAGEAAATITDAASLVGNPREATKNLATGVDAVRTAGSTYDLVGSAVSSAASGMRGALSPRPAAPPTPRAPSPPGCSVAGVCP
jgi:RHS repeat-associated protein